MLKQIWQFPQRIGIKQPTSLCAVLLLLVAADTQDPKAKIWDFGGGVSGTAAHVAQIVNGPVEENWQRVVDFQRQIDGKHALIEKQESADIAEARTTPEYRSISEVVASAKAELDAAHQRQDIDAALDAGSRYNLDRQKLQAIEAAAIKADTELAKQKEFAEQYARELKGAQAALRKAAEWRSRIVLATEASAGLDWPVRPGASVYVASANVADGDRERITIEVSASEQTGVTKNGGGDGIDTVYYTSHPIKLVISRPEGYTRSSGTIVLKHTYVVDHSRDAAGDAFAAHEDDNCTIGYLIQCIHDVHGVPASYIDQVNNEVAAKVQKELDEEMKKRQQR